MKLIIYAPVLRREWIVRQYLEHAARSAEQAGVDFSFLMVGGIADPTFEIVNSLSQFASSVARVYVDEPRSQDLRDWPKPGRLERMVELRNLALQYVREAGCDLALSLDTDILLHPDAIGNLIATQTQRGWDAVGGYCYMSANRSHPSYANLMGLNSLRRPDIRSVEMCDVLMGIILMTHRAVAVDYEYDHKGEDIGWARAAARARLTLGIDARVVNRHVMHPADLQRPDPRCDW
jgi:hypothetical protein